MYTVSINCMTTYLLTLDKNWKFTKRFRTFIRMTDKSKPQCSSSFMIDNILNMNCGTFGEINQSSNQKGLIWAKSASPDGRKLRTTFTSDQVLKLEERFDKQHYLSALERMHVARKLKLSDNQVKTWYQNRRMKLKRQQEKQHLQRYQPNLHVQTLDSYMHRQPTTTQDYSKPYSWQNNYLLNTRSANLSDSNYSNLPCMHHQNGP